MTPELLEILRCPNDQGRLELLAPASTDAGDHDGSNSTPQERLSCSSCGKQYPIIDGIPRFVEPDNYAKNFGFQWNNFRSTQLDSHAGISLSKERFYRQSQWTPDEIKGKLLLDVGCGAGRFTEIALEAGAMVVAIDFSSAVDACRENHRRFENLNVVQADIFHLPFAANSFDYIYCFGVLQHTPDVRAAFLALPEYIKPGGQIGVDIYLKRWWKRFHPKRILRPLTTRMQKDKLFTLLQTAVPALLNINRGIRAIPIIGTRLTRFVPVADYTDMYGLSQQQVQEWAILDTFDWLAPAYDSPQTPASLENWMEHAGLDNIEVEVDGFVIGRASKR